MDAEKQDQPRRTAQTLIHLQEIAPYQRCWLPFPHAGEEANNRAILHWGLAV